MIGAALLLGLAGTADAQCLEWFVFDSVTASTTEQAVDGIGDVNGDGYDDIAIGASEAAISSSKGAVYVHSGKTGELLYRVTSRELSTYRLGLQVSRYADINDDGFDDFAVQSSSVTFVLSGFDGSVIWAMVLPTSLLETGTSPASLRTGRTLLGKQQFTPGRLDWKFIPGRATAPYMIIS
jgi:hypothetical protein